MVGIVGLGNLRVVPTSSTPPVATTSAALDDSDAALAQDSQAIDDQLNALDADVSSVNQTSDVAAST
jgi:hypothetical protein